MPHVETRDKWALFGTAVCSIIVIVGIVLGTNHNPSEWGQFFWSVVWPAGVMTIWLAILICVFTYRDKIKNRL